MDVLIFCNEIETADEALHGKLEELKTSKKERTFAMDSGRIPSVKELRELLAGSGMIKVFKEREPGVVYLGTHFEHKKAKSEAYAVINTNSCTIAVFGSKSQFNDAIMKDLLDVIAQ